MTANDHAAIRERVATYYSDKLAHHGPSPKGVDWNSLESQTLRFEELSKLFTERAAGVIDYGCGYGAFADFISQRFPSVTYAGYDVSPDMIAAASRAHAGTDFTNDRASLRKSDYCVASGIFNVRLDVTDDAWLEYITSTLDDMASLSTLGMAFNALTSYSDPAKRRADLYYSSPLALFDYCKRTFSNRVVLLHDYPLYEFTILVRW